jgi:DNA-binding transcriptional LysR family regulator
MLDEQNVRHDNSIELHSVEVLKRSVMAGVGITVLPEVAVAEEVALRRLAVLPWDESKTEVAVLMIWYKERWLSPTLHAFMEITRAVMKAGTPWNNSLPDTFLGHRGLT